MKSLILSSALAFVASATLAEVDVGIPKSIATVTVQTRNGPVEIDRICGARNKLNDNWLYWLGGL